MKPPRLLKVAAFLTVSAAPLGLASQPQQAVRRDGFYTSNGVDEVPRRLSGPSVEYPATLLRALVHPAGLVRVAAIVDTSGRVEPQSVEVLSTPDPALSAPVRQMMLASQFSPGRLKGVTVRVMVQMAVEVRPPRLSATDLVGKARAQIAAGRPDSAQRLLEIAGDTVLTHLTDGERVYALLVGGIAAARAGQDSLAHADQEAGIALLQTLTARGVDLAPFVRRLADSLRFAGRTQRRAGGDVLALTLVGSVDEPPVLVSHPPIHYPREMQALRAAATVVVEAALDTAGNVEAASATVVQSPNHAFDQEARRVVRGSVYRPAKTRGRPVRAVIRQPISFVNY